MNTIVSNCLEDDVFTICFLITTQVTEMGGSNSSSEDLLSICKFKKVDFSSFTEQCGL